jgi:hypothetical protein
MDAPRAKRDQKDTVSSCLFRSSFQNNRTTAFIMGLDIEVENAINATFVLIAGFLCFLLQAGFGLLEAGSVREKVSSAADMMD